VAHTGEKLAVDPPAGSEMQRAYMRRAPMANQPPPTMNIQRLTGPFTPDAGLLYTRLTGAALLLYVHGLPKLLHWQTEMQHIEDPLHLGPGVTLGCALFAEVFCPLLVAAGLLTRLATLPVIFLLLVSMVLVHPDWSIAEGQFGWLLIIVFGTIAVSGPGRYSLDAKLNANAKVNVNVNVNAKRAI
jgi:putative oxidoreductase